MDTSEDVFSEINALLKLGGDANHRYSFHNTLLHITAKIIGTETTVEQLATAGADLNLVNRCQQTPLQVAVKHRNRKMVKALIRFGARINTKDCFGNSPLHHAIHGCTVISSNGTCLGQNDCPRRAVDIDILLMLVQHVSADINVRNSKGYTPLLWALANENFDAFTVLMSNCVGINFANNRLESPLHVALSRDCPDIRIITELIVPGACLVCSSNFNETPLDLLLKEATDDKAKDFAREILKIVAIKYQNHELIISMLEDHLPFLEFYMTCVDEAQQMRGEVVAINSSLCDFVLRRMRQTINVRYGLEHRICIKIIELIMPYKYPTYFETIINCMSEHELRYMLDSFRLFRYKDTSRWRIMNAAAEERRKESSFR